MKTVRHTPIQRFGKHEQPITIELDDGTLIDEVLYFDEKPTDPITNGKIADVVARYEARQSEPELEPPVTVDEIEMVLREKGIMLPGEKWVEWKLVAAIAIPRG